MKRFVTAFTVSALFIAAAVQMHAAAVQLSTQEAKELSATATTPAEHLKLAAYFNSQADLFEAEAIEHETSANAHRISTDALALKHPMSGNTAAHCDHFGRIAREKADANRELAIEHERMANSAEK